MDAKILYLFFLKETLVATSRITISITFNLLFWKNKRKIKKKRKIGYSKNLKLNMNHTTSTWQT